ncbi:hypothetical protein, partial [Mycobacterium tuberculosis]
SALQQVIEAAVQQHAGLTVGTYYGDYQQSHKDRLMTAITNARSNGTYLHSQYEIDKALTTLQGERKFVADSMKVALRSMPIAADNDFDRVLLIDNSEWLNTFTVTRVDDQNYVAVRARNYGTRLNNLQYNDNGEWKPVEVVSVGGAYTPLRFPLNVNLNKAADLSSHIVELKA